MSTLKLGVKVYSVFKEFVLMAESSISRLGHLLRSFREDAEINQRGMAKKLGISASYLSAIEKGKRCAVGQTAEDIKSMLKTHFSIKDIETAILMSNTSIEFSMPESDAKKEMLVLLSQSIANLSDGKASDIINMLSIDKDCYAPRKSSVATFTSL